MRCSSKVGGHNTIVRNGGYRCSQKWAGKDARAKAAQKGDPSKGVFCSFPNKKSVVESIDFLTWRKN